MNLFDQLVNEAIKNQPNYSSLRVVVEKELLHHDILRTLSQHSLLQNLTFIGGTCLRSCYGGTRLSEDLDFTGGKGFSRENLAAMGKILSKNLNKKYGLQVSISEPVKDSTNVDTWKIKIVTRPGQKNLPAQRINIDICRIPSYEIKPMMLLNPYGVEMGTSGLIIQAQSREEIYTDKLVAIALRPNRLKYRDLWDIMWLQQQGIKPNNALIRKKISDRDLTLNYFIEQFDQRTTLLKNDQTLASEFRKEMHRFLPPEQMNSIVDQSAFWHFIVNLMADFNHQMQKLV